MKEEKISGLKITVINQILIAGTAILALSLLIIMQYTMYNYEEVSELSYGYVTMDEQAKDVREASDYLTIKVHDFVATGDMKYMDAYFTEANITKRREQAIEELSAQEKIDYSGVQMAVRGSESLMKREIYAMRLMAEGCGYDMTEMPQEVQETVLRDKDRLLSSEEKKDLARSLVHDETYHGAKSLIYESLDQFRGDVLESMQLRIDEGRRATEKSLYGVWILIFLLILLNVLIALVLNLLIKKPLERFLVNIHEKTMLTESGTYEFKHLARVYNTIYREKEESDRQRSLFRFQAEHDAMTGLQNRGSAREEIREYLHRGGDPGIMILLDMDDLKGINDTYGHDQGDKAIIGIADTLKEHFRHTDIIARLGGDEFMIYLPGAGKDSGRIRTSLTVLLQKLTEIKVGGEDGRRVHCSVGCTVQSKDNSQFDLLFKEADTALYHAKRGGKNRFVFYTDEMKQEAEVLEFSVKYLND